jgi:hypothetical protein
MNLVNLSSNESSFLTSLSSLRNPVLLKVDKNGVLKPLSVFENFKYQYLKSYQTEVDVALNSYIQSIFKALSLSVVDEENIREIFIQKLSKISPKQFKRCSIPQQLIQRLKKIISKQQTIEVKGKRKELLIEKEASIGISDDFKSALVDVKLAIALDPTLTPLSPKEGTSKVSIFKDINGVCRLVVKPTGYGSTSGWHLSSKIRNFAKYIFPTFKSQEQYLVPQKEANAEALSTCFAQKFKLNVIAETHVIEINKSLSHRIYNQNKIMQGSAQLFVLPKEDEKILTATEVFKLNFFLSLLQKSFLLLVDLLSKKNIILSNEKLVLLKRLIRAFFEDWLNVKPFLDISLSAKINIQKFWIFDFLIGNLDRHGDNWFIIYKKKSKEIASIKGIDQGAAFYWKHPENHVAKRNQYKWQHLPLAKEPFTEESKILIEQILNAEPELIDACKFFMDGEKSDEVVNTLKDRLNTLKLILDTKINSPHELGAYKEGLKHLKMA